MIRKIYLTIKYFLQGDDWKIAKGYAEYITGWTRKREYKKRRNHAGRGLRSG